MLLDNLNKLKKESNYSKQKMILGNDHFENREKKA